MENCMNGRVHKSLKNLYVALIGQAIGLLISFISRMFFVKILGSEYLGVNGLFTNILTVLSLAELGVGNAIIYSLYKPIADNDEKKCCMLMQLYKKVYCIIGTVIFFVGILITPFLGLLIKDIPAIKEINLIYILFVLNTAVSYFFSYKRNLIIADQNRYIATIYRYLFFIVLNILQIIVLVIWKNYIFFLIVQVLFTVLENVLVAIRADKMYPFLKIKEKIQIDIESKKDIIKNTKAMMMHKVGGVIVTSTDNILISKFIGLSAVGIYSNYYLIINALNLVFGQLYHSLSASVGNLCTSDNQNKKYNIFKKIDFVTFVINFFAIIGLINFFNPFISIWLGKEYLYDISIVIIIAINFYITGMRQSILTFKEAEGLFYKDRFKPIFESIINLVVSIILAKKHGVFGILLGTTISSVTTCFWVEPLILYKYSFKKNILLYFKEYFKRCVIILITLFFTSFVNKIVISNIYMEFILKVFLTMMISAIILVAYFYKSEEFIYYKNLIRNLVSNFIKKLKL